MLRQVAEALAAGTVVCRYVQPLIQPGAAVPASDWQLTKSDASPVTIADLACQAVVNTHLQRAGLITGPANPGAPGMLAEESASTLLGPENEGVARAVARVLAASGAWPGEPTAQELAAAIDAADLPGYSKERPLPARYWSLDPIDGTKGFIKGRAYAVCLALVSDGQPTVCALSCPKLDPDVAADPVAAHPTGCVVLAERVVNSAGKTGWGPLWTVPLTAVGGCDFGAARAGGAAGVGRVRPELTRWTEGLERSPRDVRVLDAVIARIGGRRGVAMDSQAKYAAVSRKQADVYLRPAPRHWGMKVWDHAAGIGLCQAAGRVASDLKGRPLEFSTGFALSGQGILVCPPELHRPIIEALAGLPDAFAAADYEP